MMMRRAAVALVLLLVAASAFGGAKITVISLDAEGTVGLADPTPRAPVGGNNGTTLGQQRMNALQAAANIWGNLIESDVEIVIAAQMTSIAGCTASGGTLALTGPNGYLANFPGAPKQDVWYPVALANKFAHTDLNKGAPAILATFNVDVDGNICLGPSTHWYYGLDGKHGADIDLVTVALHEFAHGLGFVSSTNLLTGALYLGRPNIYELHTLDTTLGLRWDQLTDAQRIAAANDDQHLVWDGDAVRAAAPALLAHPPIVRAGATTVRAGNATFGAPVGVAGITASLVASAPVDGCTAFMNDVSGKIAVVQRGTCKFVDKAKNAQAAGAAAVIVVDNVAVDASPIQLGGNDSTIAIPVVSVTLADGATLATLAGTPATITLDPTRRAGMDANGYVLLYAPANVTSGSSVSHWDESATPNLLLEPSIAPDLTHGVDLTLQQLIDIGWTAAPQVGPWRAPGRRGH